MMKLIPFVTAVILAAGIHGNARAATVTYLPNSGNSQQVAANVPAQGNVWTGVAESVTAVDARVLFGFYLYSVSSSSVLYSLYAGDGVFGVALKQVIVSSPAAANGYIPILVSADFSDVVLTVGQRYTFKASQPNEGLPSSGDYSAASAAYSGVSNNPYTDGRFYFNGASYNQSDPAFSQRDLAFSMVGVTANGAVPEPATWAMMITGFGLVGGTMRRKRVAVSFC